MFFGVFLCFFFSLLLQCKFAKSTLLSLLSFSYFITHYDAQAFSALIFFRKWFWQELIFGKTIMAFGPKIEEKNKGDPYTLISFQENM